MTDVLLTHSYHLAYDRKQVQKMQPYPPLGTLYAAALLRAHGYSVALFDTMLEDPAEFSRALRRHRPRVLAIYEDNFNFLSKMCLVRMREVARHMCAEARDAGIPVVVNGSDASDHPQEYVNAGAGLILQGEAEWTLLEVVQSLVAGKPATSVPGVVFPREGTIQRSAQRARIRSLDALPFPARDLVDIESYRGLWTRAHGYFSLNAVASRGCPFRCNWCAKPIYGSAFQCRSAASVAQEMQELKQTWCAEHIWFADDIFALQRHWAEDLGREVEQRNAALPFKIQSRVDLMTEDTARGLRRAGCAETWMGVESGSQAVLDAMDKDLDVANVPAARERLRRHGIRACYFLQFGYPGETLTDIEKTIRLVRDTRPDDIGVSVSYPLPGTPFYERVRAELAQKSNWVDSGELAMMFRGAYTSEFYSALHDALHGEVDSWRTVVDPAEVERRWVRVAQLEATCRNPHPAPAPAAPEPRVITAWNPRPAQEMA